MPTGPKPPRLSSTPPTVHVKPHSYQPTKAELEEPFVIRKPDGSVPTPCELIRAALRPVNLVENSAA